MKAILKISKRNHVIIAALTCTVLAASISAFAVPVGQVFITYTPATFTGTCCNLWGDNVKVVEPTPVVPVIVTWTTEYVTSDDFYVGLSLNGGACTAYGPRTLGAFDTADGTSATFQWVLTPSNGLVKGTNRLTVCGGAVRNSSANILLGIRTLTVQIGK